MSKVLTVSRSLDVILLQFEQSLIEPSGDIQQIALNQIAFDKLDFYLTKLVQY
jgi:hypothetical protein